MITATQREARFFKGTENGLLQITADAEITTSLLTGWDTDGWATIFPEPSQAARRVQSTQWPMSIPAERALREIEGDSVESHFGESQKTVEIIAGTGVLIDDSDGMGSQAVVSNRDSGAEPAQTRRPAGAGY
jgi:hypothetical protein